jgi:hypothetical protein
MYIIPKVINTVDIVGSNVMELIGALNKMGYAARMACNGMNKGAAWGGSSTIDVEDQDGREIAHVDLIEETLSDKSKVYNVRLRFSDVQ